MDDLWNHSPLGCLFRTAQNDVRSRCEEVNGLSGQVKVNSFQGWWEGQFFEATIVFANDFEFDEEENYHNISFKR